MARLGRLIPAFAEGVCDNRRFLMAQQRSFIEASKIYLKAMRNLPWHII